MRLNEAMKFYPGQMRVKTGGNMQKVILALKIIAGLLNDLVAELELAEQPAQPETEQSKAETSEGQTPNA
jgi:hypothetical protein